MSEQDYQQQLIRVASLPKYYLGQEIVTEYGKGIIVSLSMPTNGLYISPEKSKCVVWFGCDRVPQWVQIEIDLADLS